jgi:hypothetical protein
MLIIQLLCFKTSYIILFFYLEHIFETGFCLCHQVSLLSWAQSIDLVPISRQEHQHMIGYINQAQHNHGSEKSVLNFQHFLTESEELVLKRGLNFAVTDSVCVCVYIYIYICFWYNCQTQQSIKKTHFHCVVSTEFVLD